jgi:hypothetical protein
MAASKDFILPFQVLLQGEDLCPDDSRHRESADGLCRSGELGKLSKRYNLKNISHRMHLYDLLAKKLGSPHRLDRESFLKAEGHHGLPVPVIRLVHPAYAIRQSAQVTQAKQDQQYGRFVLRHPDQLLLTDKAKLGDLFHHVGKSTKLTRDAYISMAFEGGWNSSMTAGPEIPTLCNTLPSVTAKIGVWKEDCISERVKMRMTKDPTYIPQVNASRKAGAKVYLKLSPSFLMVEDTVVCCRIEVGSPDNVKLNPGVCIDEVFRRCLRKLDRISEAECDKHNTERLI